jgi:hypothetical protein
MSVKPEHYDLIKKPIITEKATLASEVRLCFRLPWMQPSR